MIFFLDEPGKFVKSLNNHSDSKKRKAENENPTSSKLTSKKSK